jgi:LPXTG-motif cell wall-anchored protein
MDSTTIRLIAGVIAILFGALIFMRRRNRNAD